MSGARELTYLCRELKHPALLAGVERLAERARADAWSHEEFLAACLEREVSARQSHGGDARIASARFPARKTLSLNSAEPSSSSLPLLSGSSSSTDTEKG